MDGLHVFAVCVVQRIKRLGDDRVREDEVAAVPQLPLDRRVSDRADAMGASQEDWTFKKPRFLDPIDAGHVTVPFRLNVAAKTGSQLPRGRGRMAVTPVRI